MPSDRCWRIARRVVFAVGRRTGWALSRAAERVGRTYRAVSLRVTPYMPWVVGRAGGGSVRRG